MRFFLRFSHFFSFNSDFLALRNTCLRPPYPKKIATPCHKIDAPPPLPSERYVIIEWSLTSLGTPCHGTRCKFSTGSRGILAMGTVAIFQGVPQCATAYHDMPRERGKFSTEFRGKLPTYTVAATNGFPRGDKKSVAKF